MTSISKNFNIACKQKTDFNNTFQKIAVGFVFFCQG